MKHIAMALIVALMLITPLGTQPTSAQDCPLDDESCTLLNDALDNLATLETINNTDFDIGLLLILDQDAIDFRVNGAGTTSLDPFALDLKLNEAELVAEPDIDQSGVGQLRIVDDVLYLGAENADGETEWRGQAFNLAGLGGLEQSLENLLEELGTTPGAITWSRDDNLTVEGRSLAVFSFEVGLDRVLQSNAAINLLGSQLANLAGTSSSDLLNDPATVGFLINLLVTQLEEELQTSTMRLTLWVSPEDSLLYGMVVNVNLELDLGFLTGLAPDDLVLPSQISLSFDFQTFLDQHNAPVVVEAPEEWEAFEDTLNLADILGADLFSFNLGGVGGQSSGREVEFNIAYGETATGVLDDENQTDTYQFSAVTGEVVTITLEKAKAESNLDTVLELLDDDSNLVATNDDIDYTVENYNSQIILEIPEDGDYIIVAGALFIPDDGAYTLSLNVE